MLYLHLKPLLQQLQRTVNSFRVLSWIEIYSSCADLNKFRDRKGTEWTWSYSDVNKSENWLQKSGFLRSPRDETEY